MRKELKVAASALLSKIHCRICALDQRFSIVTMVGEHPDPNAASRVKQVTGNDKAIADLVEDPLCKYSSIRSLAYCRQQNHELIAAQTRYRVLRASQQPEARGYLLRSRSPTECPRESLIVLK